MGINCSLLRLCVNGTIQQGHASSSNENSKPRHLAASLISEDKISQSFHFEHKYFDKMKTTFLDDDSDGLEIFFEETGAYK